MNYDDWGMAPARDFMYPVEYHIGMAICIHH